MFFIAIFTIFCTTPASSPLSSATKPCAWHTAFLEYLSVFCCTHQNNNKIIIKCEIIKLQPSRLTQAQNARDSKTKRLCSVETYSAIFFLREAFSL